MAKTLAKTVLISAAALVLVVGAAFAGTLIHFESRFGRPFETYTATFGEVGDLRIGESKREILARLTAQSFAIEPRPAECPTAWIDVSAMSDAYRSCLLDADHWEEGRASTGGLCTQPSNAFTKLTFREGTLASVTTECWHPK